jgi:hypothetical protein
LNINILALEVVRVVCCGVSKEEELTHEFEHCSGPGDTLEALLVYFEHLEKEH